MQLVQVFDNIILKAAGSETAVEISKLIPGALNAKSLGYYLLMTSFKDASTQVAIEYDSSPDGKNFSSTQPIRAAAAVGLGMERDSSATDVTTDANIRIHVKVDAGANATDAQLSLWVVLKPF